MFICFEIFGPKLTGGKHGRKSFMKSSLRFRMFFWCRNVWLSRDIKRIVVYLLVELFEPVVLLMKTILKHQSICVQVQIVHDRMASFCYLVQSFNPLTGNPTKWSNTLKQFVGNSRQVVWVCLTILWCWCLKD